MLVIIIIIRYKLFRMTLRMTLRMTIRMTLRMTIRMTLSLLLSLLLSLDLWLSLWLFLRLRSSHGLVGFFRAWLLSKMTCLILKLTTCWWIINFVQTLCNQHANCFTFSVPPLCKNYANIDTQTKTLPFKLLELLSQLKQPVYCTSITKSFSVLLFTKPVNCASVHKTS